MNKYKADETHNEQLTNQLLEHMNTIEIPKELDSLVNAAIEKGKKQKG